MNRWFKKFQTRLQDRVKQWLGINSISVRIAANAIVSDARYHVIENKLAELERLIQSQAENIDLAAANRYVDYSKAADRRHAELLEMMTRTLEIVTRIDKALTNAHAYEKPKIIRSGSYSFEDVQVIALESVIAEDGKDSN